MGVSGVMGGGVAVLSREEIRKGVRVRLVANSLDVPARTSATVDDLGVVSGSWWFTVRYDTYESIVSPNTGPLRKRRLRSNASSLRQWESDLAMFEQIDEIAMEARPVPACVAKIPKRPVGWRTYGLEERSVHSNQLALFPTDDF